MSAKQRLEVAVWEADRHLDTLTEALRDWDAAPAGSLPALESDRGKVRLVDQILFRYAKLQDAFGERLIPATLAVLREPFEEWPVRDRLNRLEKLGYVDVDQWLSWRETRSRLAHEYPDAPISGCPGAPLRGHPSGHPGRPRPERLLRELAPATAQQWILT